MHMPCEECGIRPAVEGGGGLCGECDLTENLSDFDDHESYDDEEEGDDCYECGGEMFIVDDCFEDTCCCADPEAAHGLIPCPNCNPDGAAS